MLNRTGKQVYYYSCQVTKDPCSCRSCFGADAHQGVIPTCSALWTSCDEFKTLFDATVQENYAGFGSIQGLLQLRQYCYRFFGPILLPLLNMIRETATWWMVFGQSTCMLVTDGLQVGCNCL